MSDNYEIWTTDEVMDYLLVEMCIRDRNIGEFVNTLYAKGTSDNILHSKIYIDLKI